MEPSTVQDVIARMSAIDGELDPSDGAAVFNAIYLRVTRGVGDLLAAGGTFADPAFMEQLDVTFARYWFDAYDDTGRSRAWAPLFECRHEPLLPIQFALAGMNAHIEHDLPLAVVASCAAHGREPSSIRADYERVNDLLASIEAEIRRSFLDQLGRAVDDRVGRVAHLVSAWDIEKARDAAWATVCLLWEIRGSAFLTGLQHDVLERAVGMGSRLLLTPVD
ncbi:MAG TPA: DUF5995 family protein [Nocardioides sp.]|nr:DUF5995 family protein [Nocardioides sp.]